MPLSAGRRLGPYEIVESIGSGGMGEVYRARDTKLNRFVAIKVLPAHFARDPARLQRLQREAQVLASLNHPQIATIHGLEESEGTSALVMELVEGEDLKQRIARGALPVSEALAVARQIALALEAAHAQGIVHRDLKPANIKVRADGAVKVLDFGLAKSTELETPSLMISDSPTVTTPAALTEAGLLLGTAAYMSPEQARGKPADKRADVWGFGCVLFEMLTARSIFPGATVTETLAGVLERQPDWSALPAETPPAIRRLLRRSLEKDRTRRLHDMADARIEIEDAQAGVGTDSVVAIAPAASRGRRIGQGVIVVLALLVTGAAGWFLRPTEEASEARLDLATPTTADGSLAISPDGRSVVYAARAGGTAQLWLRSLDGSVTRPIAGTEQGTMPFWSPDGRSIAFFADVKLKRVDLDGGSARTLAVNCVVPIGGTWSQDGTILFADNPGGPIRRTNAQGAEPVPETRVDAPAQRGHFYPLFLPDGRHFLLYVSGTAEGRGVFVGQLGGPAPRRLFDADSAAVYSPTGHLLFVRGRKLYSQRFDAAQGELRGDAVAIQDLANAGAVVSVSAAGPIAYREIRGDSGQRQLLWVDRAGSVLRKVIYTGNAAQGPALSHDGRQVAVFRYIDGNMDLWSYDKDRGLWERLTSDLGDDIYPLWSRDDKSLIFTGVRKGAPLALFMRLVKAAPETEEPLLKAPGGEFPMDWSADGRFLLFGRADPKRGVDIWAMPILEPGRTPFAVVATDANESIPAFSPDGKWIAYQSDKSGRDEIYVRPFPGPGDDVRVSTEGGIQARWNPKGGELFYIGADDQMMVVSIRLPPDTKAVEIGKPGALFATTIGSAVRLKFRQQYAVTPDGKAFMLNSSVDDGSAPPIKVILNWKPTR